MKRTKKVNDQGGLQLCEIFTSIQGEGPRVGERSLFVRFSGCNLYCSRCDTKYSFGEQIQWRTTELLCYLNTASAVVITGGEPFLQREGLKTILIDITCVPQVQHTTVETNGTYPPLLEMYEREDLTWVISPKLSCMGPKHPPEVKVLREWVGVNSSNIYFKFVIEPTDSSFREMIDLLDQVGPPSRLQNPIYIQPLGSEQGTFRVRDYLTTCRKVLDLLEQTTPYEFRFVPQIHKLLWGNARGK